MTNYNTNQINDRLISAWQANKCFFLFIILMFAFRSAVADWNVVPSGSMKPTIVEGDRILVNKVAYDIRIPFTRISLYDISDPARGDIVIFDSSASQKRLVKRVIGTPGDTVRLKNNKLFINGRPLNYTVISSTDNSSDMMENLFGLEYGIRVNKQPSTWSNFPSVKIPENHYLVLGDNRDNSADSRVIGFVPRNEIVGRSRTVVLSLNYKNNYIPRPDRYFHPL